MKRRQSNPARRAPRFAALGLTAIALAVPLAVGATYFGRAEGAVYSLSNAPSGNRVLIFDRMSDGSLDPRRSFPTGGNGTGGGLGNQGALALSDSGNWLLAVNPGSDSISVFLVFGNHLLRTDVESSRGMQPVSVAIEDDIVYVLNAGSDNVQGFRLAVHGKLIPIPGSRRTLSARGAGAAQVSFNRAGDLLAVTEKATNRVLTFAVDGDGKLGETNVQDSPAPTPFGFAFGRRDQMLVSEAAGGAAAASTLTSWQLRADGSASPITAAVPSQQTAACWVAVTRDGRYAYVANTGSNNLSTYVVDEDGAASLADAIAAQTGAGSAPADLALDRGSRFLYALNPGTGSISAFRVGTDGALQLIEHQATGAAVGGATGLVAR
ncbi:lactonase family protein [Luteimonas salinilitoris]|uniref:Lactonase family protein n=1 Tax=Luteimonas salinilitoris TaxID=3237697 RepID=A0ABV4HPJ0_9GAMM